MPAEMSPTSDGDRSHCCTEVAGWLAWFTSPWVLSSEGLGSVCPAAVEGLCGPWKVTDLASDPGPPGAGGRMRTHRSCSAHGSSSPVSDSAQ